MGTLWAVDNVIARDAAHVFYGHLLSGSTLLDSFYEMTRAIQEPKYRNIYFYWGLHFNSLKAPLQNPDQEVFNVLLASLARWQQEYDSTTDPELQRHCLRVLRFLSRELRTNFTPSHLAQLNADIGSRLSNAEDSSQQEDRQDKDSTARGVMDI